MVFNDTTNLAGCIQFIERLVKTGSAGITGDTTLFKQVTASFNQGIKNVFVALLKADRNWKVDDSAYTDFPTAQIDLSNGVRDYPLPTATVGGDFSTLYRINNVRILNAAGNKENLELLDAKEDINNELYSAGPSTGTPTHYRLNGKSILLFPTPATGSVTMTDGLEIDFQRAPDPFTTADTTQQPGFIDAFHDVPCYYAAAEHLLPTNPQLASLYQQTYQTRLKELVDFKTNMDDNSPRRLTAEYVDAR